ncbi:MAG: hypothetical protein MJ090_02990 [Clostridia bacterium]|nr:hypothetical protein [Clostridia bacterium]
MKRLFCFMFCAVLCLSLTGCKIFVFDTENLLSPPELTGELKPVQDALADSIDGEYTFEYPSVGDIKSAVTLDDLDGDGEKEAIVFYGNSDAEQKFLHINIIVKNKSGYKSVDDVSVTASGVERVDFVDLNGDGQKEIIVGWEIYADSEKHLSVYSFADNTLSERTTENYTNYLCYDLNEDKKPEVLIQQLNSKKGENKAGVYSFSDKGLSRIADCLLDSKVKSAERFKLSTLSNGKPAVYIDEIKGIGAVTEVLFFKKNELVNPLLDTENSAENTRTVRSSTISCADVNGDGVIEIPIASDIPCADADSSERIFYTNWCSYNGERLTVKLVSVENTADGYSLNIPTRFIGKIAVSRNIEKRTRTIYKYDSAKGITGEKILTLTAFEKQEFDQEKIKESENLKIFSKDNTVVICEAHLKGKTKLTGEELENIVNFTNF